MRPARDDSPLNAAKGERRSSWFRTVAGHRFGREIAALLILKVALLLTLWWVVVHPATRADTSPAAVARHLGTTAPAGSSLP